MDLRRAVVTHGGAIITGYAGGTSRRPDLSFTQVGRGEVVAFALVWARADAALHGRPVPRVAPDEAVAEFGNLLQHDDRAWAVLAYDDTEPVGAVRLTDARSQKGSGPPIPGRAHVASLVVEPSRWGTGIGTALVLEAEASATTRGYETAQLVVHDTNARAKALYHRLDWTRAADHVEIDGALLLRFEKRLT